MKIEYKVLWQGLIAAVAAIASVRLWRDDKPPVDFLPIAKDQLTTGQTEEIEG